MYTPYWSSLSMSWPYWSFLCSYMPAEVPHTCLRLLEFPTHFYAPLELPMYVYALPGIIQGWYACSSIFFCCNYGLMEFTTRVYSLLEFPTHVHTLLQRQQVWQLH